jgi:putative nucleotidyltransferase with HDIG domain
LIVSAVRIAVPTAPVKPTRKDGIEIIRKLEPLPMVVTKLLQLLQRKDIGLKEISDSICSDPAFSAEVLRMANSAMIGAVSEVRSIWQALAMVGLDRVKGLALTVGMRGFMGKNANFPVLRKAWRHTLATAILAEEIADKIYIDPAEAYTAGLLHDIGRIALIATNPQKYADLLDTIPGNPLRLVEVEQAAFGIDHREAGLELVRKWKLPPLFERVIARHKITDPELSVFDCPALIGLSCGLAHVMGLGILPQPEDADWQTECDKLTQKMPEADRKRIGTNWEDLQLKVASKVNLMDSEAFH